MSSFTSTFSRSKSAVTFSTIARGAFTLDSIAAASGGLRPPARYASTIAAAPDRRRRPRSPCAWAAPAAPRRPAPCAAFRSSTTFSKMAGDDAREDLLARFLARQPVAHRIAPCATPRRARQRDRPPARDAPRRQSIAGRDDPARRERAEHGCDPCRRHAARATPATTARCPARPAPSIIASDRADAVVAGDPQVARELAWPSAVRTPGRVGAAIEHHAAADRDRRRVGAQDEAIAARQHRRRFEPQRGRARRRPARSRSPTSPAIETRPSTSAVPWCTRTRAPCLSGLRRGSRSISASTRRVTLSASGVSQRLAARRCRRRRRRQG